MGRKANKFAVALATCLIAIVSLASVACSGGQAGQAAGGGASPASADVDAAQSVVMSKHASFGFDCASCHGSVAQADYTVSGKETCLSCHNGTYEALAEKTKSLTGKSTYATNPHQSHIGEAECYLCHKNHSESTLYCNECHTPEFDFTTP